MSERRETLKNYLTLPVIKTLDKQAIEHNIPHREPFLLVDEVRVLEEKKKYLGKHFVRPDEMVVPGDLLEMPIEIIRFGKISKIYAEAYVNGKLCTQASLTFILGETPHA